MFGNDLHLTALLVERKPPAKEHVQTVLRAEAQQRGLSAKEHGGKLPFVVLNGEVDVAGSGWPQVADFALDPEIGEAALDVGAQLCDNLAYLPDAAGRGLWRFKAEAKLRCARGILHNDSVYLQR